MRSKQSIIKVKYFDTEQKEPLLLRVQAYGQTFTPARVVHGSEFMCPEPAIDNVKIFRLEDYPKQKTLPLEESVLSDAVED